jgi:hypothetical protein
MWARNFAQRLTQWSELRARAGDQDLEECLLEVNSWWFDSPWSNFYLHWDDRQTWPDPWQLLHDNIYCSLARGLGIMYTLTLLDRPDCDQAVLVESGADNLVIVNDGQWVLNYAPDQIADIKVDIVNTPRRISQQDIKKILC